MADKLSPSLTHRFALLEQVNKPTVEQEGPEYETAGLTSPSLDADLYVPVGDATQRLTNQRTQLTIPVNAAPSVRIDVPDDSVRVDVRKNASGQTVIQATMANGSAESWTAEAGAKIDIEFNGGELNVYDGAELGMVRSIREAADVRVHDGNIAFLVLSDEDDTLTVGENGSISGYASLGGGRDRATIAGTVQTVGGDDGADIIDVVGSGAVTGRIHGGDGFDQISVKDDATVKSIHSGNDDDIVFVEDRSEVGDVFAGSGNDILEIQSRVGEVHGQSGNDSIRVGGSGSATVGSINGGSDNDDIFVWRGEVGRVDGSTGADTLNLYGAEDDYTFEDGEVRHNVLGTNVGQLDNVETTEYFDLVGDRPTSDLTLGSSFGQGNILTAYSLAQRPDATEAQLLDIADFFAAAGQDVPDDIFMAMLANPAVTSDVIDRALPSDALTDPELPFLLAVHPHASEELKASITEADNGIRIEDNDVHIHDGDGESMMVINLVDGTLSLRHVDDEHPDESDFAIYHIADDGSLESTDRRDKRVGPCGRKLGRFSARTRASLPRRSASLPGAAAGGFRRSSWGFRDLRPDV